MTAEDKMGRAWLIVAIVGLAGAIAAITFVGWMFWQIASYL